MWGLGNEVIHKYAAAADPRAAAFSTFIVRAADLIHRDFDRNKWLFADEAVSYGCADKIVERAPENMVRAKRDEDEDDVR